MMEHHIKKWCGVKFLFLLKRAIFNLIIWQMYTYIMPNVRTYCTYVDVGQI